MSDWTKRTIAENRAPADPHIDARVEYRLEGDEQIRHARAGDLCWGNFEHDGGVGRISAWRMAAAMPVGDVNGTTKGSGARANGGKPAVELIPAGVLAEYTAMRRLNGPVSSCSTTVALANLGLFQMRGGDSLSLYRALLALDPDGSLIDDTARVFDYGRKKYSAWNWARGMAWSIPIGCAIRHLLAMVDDPAALDPESGLPHRGHVGCNIVMLSWFGEYYPEGDDRPRLP